LPLSATTRKICSTWPVRHPLGLGRHRAAALALAADAALAGSTDTGRRIGLRIHPSARLRLIDGLALAGLLAGVLVGVAAWPRRSVARRTASAMAAVTISTTRMPAIT
jgi:hypothetical protein